MTESFALLPDPAVVEEDGYLTLLELSRASRAPEAQIHVWVIEGVLAPLGQQPDEWRFVGTSLRRARLAWRLTQDLEVNAPGVALALDLLDEIATLRAGLRRGGGA